MSPKISLGAVESVELTNWARRKWARIRAANSLGTTGFVT